MKVVGLTGGIGCGKTTVAGILEKHFSMKVIYTDEIAKEQMQKGGISYPGIVGEFGAGILRPDGEIDKEKLADIVFHDIEKRKKLNALTHPRVQEMVLHLLDELKELGLFKAVFIETALFIEAGYTTFCDEVWYVYAPETERRERLKKYRNMADADIDAVFAGQHSDAEFRKYADQTIDNSDAITVNSMFEQLLSLTGRF